MPRALVLGASGQIGRFLVPRLLECGHEVLALSRVPRTSSRAGLHWLTGDLFAAMPSLPRLDSIFSLGPLDGFSGWLRKAHIDGPRRIVAFSSMSVVSKRESSDPAERALAETLRVGEQQLIDAAGALGIDWTLLRPTLIYGAGIDRSLTPLARMGRRLHVFPRLPAASGLRQPVHAGDLAEACLAAAAHAAACNQMYALGGGERLAFSVMLDRVRGSLPTRVIGIPFTLSSASAALAVARVFPRWRGIHSAAVQRLTQDLLADDSVARKDLGWSPRGFWPDASTWHVLPLF